MVSFFIKIGKTKWGTKVVVDRFYAHNIVTPAILGCVLGTRNICGTQNGTHNVIFGINVDGSKTSK